MSTYLDFESTKNFRNYILGKTLSVPNGPQTFTANDYMVSNLNTFPNIDQGDVTIERDNSLTLTKGTNIYKPLDYLVIDYFENIPRRANLNLYPYFRSTNDRTLVSVFSSSNYEDESELFKFSSSYIKNDRNGPVFSRLGQNLYRATAGKLRVLDALGGNTTTAINIVTGKEPLIEFNTKITVAKTLVGKGFDFLQTVAGVTFPWSEIPGDYLSDPRNPVNFRPTANTEVGALFQDITGSLGSLLGIQRRPKLDRKPSDLFIEYLGEGQKQILYDNLSYSKYAPNYTTTARSQNSSKIFNFVDNLGMNIKNVLGLEAPNSIAYIGDDRGNDVKYAMNDFNDVPVRSNYYLSLMFDSVQTRLLKKDVNYSEGGKLSGNLTWISSKSKNKFVDSPDFQETLSTNFGFREDSIIGKTQELLEFLPTNGKEMRSHIANVIDQTSRVFKEGDLMLSRGSAIKYVDKFTGEESGVEFCRVWTKDNAYTHNSNLQKNGKNIREFESSVLSTPYNINIYPNSNGNGSFDNSSTNMKEGPNGFYAKKYMFSIENLAWKTSNVPGYTYNDLPYCERGNNGGRVMWFPPYDLKVSEQNSAEWESNTFLGRPEPIYTYKNSARNGTISFKVIVDHPSVLNLLVRKHFEKMSDEESNNYINAFFAGCENVNLYDLIRKYPTLTQTDLEAIISYLEGGTDPITVERYKTEFLPVKDSFLPEETTTNSKSESSSFKMGANLVLYFNNDVPKSTNPYYSNEPYDILYSDYMTFKPTFIEKLEKGIDDLFNMPNTENKRKDLLLLTGSEVFDEINSGSTKTRIVNQIESGFSELQSSFTILENELTEIKTLLENKKIKTIRIIVSSSASSPNTGEYNLRLSYRRTDSVLKYVLNKLSLGGNGASFRWPSTITDNSNVNFEDLPPISFKELGYDSDGEVIFDVVKNSGEFRKSEKANLDCSNSNYFTPELRVTAPDMFYCRSTEFAIGYTLKDITDEFRTHEQTVNASGTSAENTVLNPLYPKVNIIVEKDQIKRKPPQDEIKKIIMKTLSECYYFKKLEEDSPIVFNSLKEKFRYFHPAFHSMTPEGLNSRLTFLLQCLRPGDTIPIKGISDVSDLDSRNTTFGPPPICVLRIGDFFHSKIVVKNVDISYDDSPWDLNPEGIGIQPMIANVQIQVSFIGGHGLEKPVERLQNALSSNFYANTEMYDYRSIATEDRTDFNKRVFSKEFLEELGRNVNPPTIPRAEESNILFTGIFIGEINNKTLPEAEPNDIILSYGSLVGEIFSTTKQYFNTYVDVLKYSYETYGPKISSIFFSPKYRTVYQYDVINNVNSLELIGVYNKFNHLPTIVDYFKRLMIEKIDNTNITNLFGLDKDLNTTKLTKSEIILKKYVRETISTIIDNMSNLPNLKSLESTRNQLINNLDRINFIVETNQDAKLDENENAISGFLMGFNNINFYSNYKDCISYIENNHSKLTDFIDDESFIFGSPTSTITDEQLLEFLSILLKDKKQDILKLYRETDPIIFDDKTINKISRRLDKYLKPGVIISPKLSKFPNRINYSDLSYVFVENSNILTPDQIEKLKLINSTKVNVGTKLNYYKP